MTAQPLDALIIKLGPMLRFLMTELVFATCLITGVAFFVAAIFKMAQPEARHPQKQIFSLLGIGTILLNLAYVLDKIEEDLFLAQDTSSIAAKAYVAVDTLAGAKGHELLYAVFAVVQAVGLVAFLRGFFVLKHLTDGHGNASMMQAGTFIVGGALAINIDVVVGIVNDFLFI